MSNGVKRLLIIISAVVVLGSAALICAAFVGTGGSLHAFSESSANSTQTVTYLQMLGVMAPKYSKVVLWRGKEEHIITDQNKIQSLLSGLAKNKLVRQPDGAKPKSQWKYRLEFWAADDTGVFSFTDTGDFRKDPKCSIPGSAGYYLPQYPDMIGRLLDSYCREILGAG